jgi:hypothetical protein
MRNLPVRSQMVAVVLSLFLAIFFGMAMAAGAEAITGRLPLPQTYIGNTTRMIVGSAIDFSVAMGLRGLGQTGVDVGQNALIWFDHVPWSAGNTWSGHYSPGWWNSVMRATAGPRQFPGGWQRFR